MNMDRKTLAGLVLCVVVYLVYEFYMKSKYADYYKYEAERRRKETAAEQSAATAGSPSPSSSEQVTDATAQSQVTRLTPEELKLETDTSIYHFSQDRGGIERVLLKEYRATKDRDSELVNLVDSPLALQGILDAGQVTPAVGVFQAERDGRTIRFTRDVPGFRITQEYIVPQSGYGLELKVSFTNTSATAMDVTAGLLAHELVSHKKASAVLGFIPGVVAERNSIVYRNDGSYELLDASSFCEESEIITATQTPVDFIGFDKHYFLSALTPKTKTSSFRITHGTNAPDACPIAITTYDRQGILQPEATLTLEYDAYFGPKDDTIMAAYNPTFESTVHSGMFSFIGRPLLAIIEGFHKVTGNWGVAIVFLTVLLKILFYPLMKASATSAHRMKKLNPEMQAIKERNKDDPRKQQQELMKFMAQHKINPMKGCLPVLPTIPVFLAFYQVLQTSIQLRHAPFFGWIQDLSAMDPYFVTPILLGIAMLIQQKLTPPTGMDKTQEKILMFMPVLFTVMMATLPAGLTLYSLTNTVLGIAQQKWLYTKLDKQEAA